MDIFKRPVVIILILVAIVGALIWSYVTKAIEQNKQAKQAESSSTTTLDLTTADAKDFDEVVKKELATANAKALENSASNRLVAVELTLPSLQINSGDTRYIFSSGDSSTENWTITFAQSTDAYLRASIPKEDYLGTLPAINTNLWKFNYVTAIQIFEKNGGLDWRNNNGLSDAVITLKHGGKNNWLVWYMVYKSGDASFSRMIDANSGKIIEE